jgi:RHS repeat-associated protein
MLQTLHRKIHHHHLCRQTTDDGACAFAVSQITPPIILTATATVPLGQVSYVEFYVRGVLFGRVNRGQTGNSGNTYTLTWTPNTIGSYHITTRVVDERGTGVFSNYALNSGGIVATVNALTQTISFPAPAANSLTIGGSAPLTATASSMLSVTITSATPSICTVTPQSAPQSPPQNPPQSTAQSVNLLAAGTCTVNADQAGNNLYLPAPRVSISISIGKQSQTITNFTTNPQSPIAYAANPVNRLVALTAIGGLSGNPIVFASQTPSVCSVGTGGGGGSNTIATILTTGTCTLTANQAGNASYNAAAAVTTNLTIGKGSQTITNFNPPGQFSGAIGDTITLSATGGGSANAVTFTASPAGVCTLGSTTTTANILTVASLGTCTVTADQAGNTNYEAAPQVSATIAFAAQTVQVYYIHADHLGTPRVITKATDNSKVWEWKNDDPFGNNAPDENPNGVNGSGSNAAFKYNLRFPGQYFDQETGTYYNYFRDYDPSTGRYVQSDPIGLRGGINTYGYVDANPVAAFDPNGLEKLILFNPIDWTLYRSARNDPDIKGMLIVYGHGNPASVVDDRCMVCKSGEYLNAKDLAKRIKDSGAWKSGMPIWLKSCSTGASNNGIAQQLADTLGVKVLAPDNFAWFSPSVGYLGSFGMNRDGTLNGSLPGVDRPFDPRKGQ